VTDTRPDTLGQLAHALDVFGRTVDSVGHDRWDDATGCPGWSVRDLVDHVTVGNATVTGALDGKGSGTSFRDTVAPLHAAFARPGALEQMVTVPFGTVPATELLVHGWDLARATGQAAPPFAADLAEQELAFTVAALADMPPDRSPFSPPRPVADDAPALDRLAARLGRDVTAPRPDLIGPKVSGRTLDVCGPTRR